MSDRWAVDHQIQERVDHRLMGAVREVRLGDPERYGPLYPRPEGGSWPWELPLSRSMALATLERR